ncbi:MAG: V-type ATP synthase subunit I [Cuniculiplasma sp.]
MHFKPVPMTRMRIIAYREKAGVLLTLLHDMNAIQFEDVTADYKVGMKSSTNLEQRGKIIELLNEIRGIESLLPPRKVQGRKKFSSLTEIITAAQSVRIGGDLKIAVESINDLKTQLKSIENRLDVLNPLKDLDVDMSCFNNSVVSSYIVRGDYEAPEDNGYIIIKVGTDTVVAVPKAKEKEFAQSIGSEPGKVLFIMEMKGKPSDLRDQLLKMKEKATREISELEAGIGEISDQNYYQIVSIREALEIEAKKVEAAMKMPSSQSIFVMEGWVPAPKFEKISSAVERKTSNLCFVEKVETDEIGPTLQDNPKRFRLFESFIRFYSLPQDAEIDPTIIFAIVFPIFFGIMVGDWGFGIIILLLSLWLTRRINSSGKKRPLPRKLTGFITSIFSPYQLQILARAMLPGAVVAIIVGILFNGFFGFAILPTQIGSLHITYFDPIVYTSKILLMTGYFGVIMVSFGFILGILNDYYYSHKKMIIGKVGWLLFVWGIVIYGLSLIYKLNLSPTTNPFADVDIGSMIAGVIMIIATEKGIGLIELPSVISHVLSYLRIMGILLASVILTKLVNSFFLSTLNDPILIIFGVILLIIGQMFALLLAIVESGIQGVRLLYVEFFSKFYRGNGKPFSPFGTRRRYTEENLDTE